MKIRIGYPHPDRLISYPDPHNLSVWQQPIHVSSRRRHRWTIWEGNALDSAALHEQLDSAMPPQVVQYPQPTSSTAHSSRAADVEGAGGTCRGADEQWRDTSRHAETTNSTPGATGVEGGQRDLPRCRWAVAGPGRATRRHPDRLEAAARPAGPGRASRSTTPSRRLACGDLAGGQATRRPEIRRGAATPEIRRSHKQPGPTGHSPASDQRLTGTQRLAHSVVTSARAGRCAELEAASTRSTASSMTGTPSTGV